MCVNVSYTWCVHDSYAWLYKVPKSTSSPLQYPEQASFNLFNLVKFFRAQVVFVDVISGSISHPYTSLIFDSTKDHHVGTALLPSKLTPMHHSPADCCSSTLQAHNLQYFQSRTRLNQHRYDSIEWIDRQTANNFPFFCDLILNFYAAQSLFHL